MWKNIVSYLLDSIVFMQVFIAFFIPCSISRFFSWISTSKEE
ncbi:hypothetical protein COJ96_13695 [Bacillus sp. AFS073361]|nr:hypothetical protein COJ96_13695 [Bacillus sp. AFS073361]